MIREIAQFADDSPGDAISSVYTTETAFGTLMVCETCAFLILTIHCRLSCIVCLVHSLPMSVMMNAPSSHAPSTDCLHILLSTAMLMNNNKKTSKRKRTYLTFLENKAVFLKFLFITRNSLED